MYQLIPDANLPSSTAHTTKPFSDLTPPCQTIRPFDRADLIRSLGFPETKKKTVSVQPRWRDSLQRRVSPLSIEMEVECFNSTKIQRGNKKCVWNSPAAVFGYTGLQDPPVRPQRASSRLDGVLFCGAQDTDVDCIAMGKRVSTIQRQEGHFDVETYCV